jgi:predicted transcriptional regulator
MSKAILMSIKPKWVELILNGKKTIEVRKTAPKLETPFKCYIYCTKARKPIIVNSALVYRDDDLAIIHTPYGVEIRNPYGSLGENDKLLNGKVVAEFTCNKVQDNFKYLVTPKGLENACLEEKEVENYLGHKGGYGLLISDLKVYDQPKELSEFKKAGFMTEEEWLFNLYPNTHCHYEAWAKRFNLERPPQSWCYVEEIK